jgi:hypothetical protein
MKPLKQRSIPKGTVEIVMRGSKHDTGNLSAKFIVPSFVAGRILEYGLPHTASKTKKR